MRGKRIPRITPRLRRERPAAWQVIARQVTRAMRAVIAPPRESATFDARQNRLLAWLARKDRELFHWFRQVKAQMAHDLRPGPTVALRPRDKARRFISRLKRDDSGVTMIITALFMSVILTVSAMAVDVGYIYLQNRKLQGLADLAAIAAASDLENAQRAAQRAVDIDNWPEPLDVVVTTGSYTADPSLSAERRFVANGTPRNAARVLLRSRSPLFFGAAILNQETVDIARSGVATTVEMTSFSIGTRLASLQGGIANSLLSALTGSKVSLSVMDYEALLKTDVELLKYVEALRTRLDLKAATFNETLTAKLDTGTAIDVLADVVRAAGGGRAAAALDDLANATIKAADIAVGDIIDVGRYGAQDRVSLRGQTSVKANVMDIANAALTLAGEGRQVKLDLGATIPGLASIEVWLAIGERPNETPWFTVTDRSEPVVRTAQTRLYILTKIAPGAGILSTNGIVSVELPIYIELASAEAKLDSVSCPADPAKRVVNMLARPSIGHISIASIDRTKLNNFKAPLVESPATLASVLVLQVTGKARVDLGGTTWKPLKFTQKDITDGAIKTASTDDIAQSLASSLFKNVQLDVKLLGLGLGLGKGPVETAVSNLLGSVAKPLDGVLNQVTGLLGVQLGQADVRVNGLRCHAAALVL